MPGVRVTVRLSGPLIERLGHRQGLQLDEGATVGDLLDALARDGRLEAGATDGLAVVAGGTIVPRGRTLADGDELDVLVPVAGG
ncbi:MAG TPA: MoaD/ThiS family protein [Gaiellaceae bacterium]|nr:MoaD/ThiS family protein [Gaiellaceae bacterium]